MSPSVDTPIGSAERTQTSGTSALNRAIGRIFRLFKLTPGTRARLPLGRPARVVLWGGRPRDFQAGSTRDRDRLHVLELGERVLRRELTINEARRELGLQPIPRRARLPR